MFGIKMIVETPAFGICENKFACRGPFEKYVMLLLTIWQTLHLIKMYIVPR